MTGLAPQLSVVFPHSLFDMLSVESCFFFFSWTKESWFGLGHTLVTFVSYKPDSRSQPE